MAYRSQIDLRLLTDRSGIDPLSQIELPIEESPLIAMDVSLYGSNYMNLKDHKIIQSKLRQLYETTDCVGGRFEFLWHNSNLSGYEDFYENVVASLNDYL